MQENRTFLKKVAIFQDLADSELQSVAEMFKERQYKRNEIIFVEEDTGQYMYVVKKGRVKAGTDPIDPGTSLTRNPHGGRGRQSPQRLY